MAHAEVVLVRDDREVSLGWVSDRRRCDLGLVEELAQIQLAARRHGWSIRLRRTSPELIELLELTGLTDVLASEPRCHPPRA